MQLYVPLLCCENVASHCGPLLLMAFAVTARTQDRTQPLGVISVYSVLL